jgi:hypothetical protein
MRIHPAIAMLGVLVALLLASACAVVREEEDGQTTRVAITTPVGDMAARIGDRDNQGDTGMPVYPGARLSRDDADGDSEQANVAIGTPWFGLRVIAAEYESRESPERIRDFYRERLKPFGAVTECRGDVNFRNGHPECRSQPDSDDVQFLVGTEERHRIVTLTRRNLFFRQRTRGALVSPT